MSLRERALQEWRKEEARRKEEEREAAEKFAKRVEEDFKSTFGEVSELKVIPETGDAAEVIADGMKFRAVHRPYGAHFGLQTKTIWYYLYVKCKYCEREFLPQIRCNSLADLGRFLEREGHICGVCSRKQRYGDVSLNCVPPGGT